MAEKVQGVEEVGPRYRTSVLGIMWYRLMSGDPGYCCFERCEIQTQSNSIYMLKQ